MSVSLLLVAGGCWCRRNVEFRVRHFVIVWGVAVAAAALLSVKVVTLMLLEIFFLGRCLRFNTAQRAEHIFLCCVVANLMGT
jgi:hypothetical protein